MVQWKMIPSVNAAAQLRISMSLWEDWQTPALSPVPKAHIHRSGATLSTCRRVLHRSCRALVVSSAPIRQDVVQWSYIVATVIQAASTVTQPAAATKATGIRAVTTHTAMDAGKPRYVGCTQTLLHLTRQVAMPEHWPESTRIAGNIQRLFALALNHL